MVFQSPASGGLTEELRSDARTVAEAAKDRISGEIDARKGVATSQAQSLSSALDKAAGELDESPEWLRSLFQQGAQQLQRFAATVERKDALELTRDVQQMARLSPGVFLSACALGGFAAARVFKAGASGSAASSRSSSTEIQPYAGEEVGRVQDHAQPSGSSPSEGGSNSPAGFVPPGGPSMASDYTEEQKQADY